MGGLKTGKHREPKIGFKKGKVISKWQTGIGIKFGDPPRYWVALARVGLGEREDYVLEVSKIEYQCVSGKTAEPIGEIVTWFTREEYLRWTEDRSSVADFVRHNQG